jgi:DNA-binding response OmpR family regulator
MTAYPSPENEQKILECGARVCMTKPLDLDVLLKEVEASL